MEGLLALLFLAVWFYLMMRMHMGHSANGGKEKNHMAPVCGMQVNPSLGYGRMYEGILYRFCSRNCLDKFDSDPAKYSGNHQEYIHHA